MQKKEYWKGVGAAAERAGIVLPIETERRKQNKQNKKKNEKEDVLKED